MGFLAIVRCRCSEASGVPQVASPCLHGNGWLCEVSGQYDEYLGFQDSVSALLESGRRGSRFPLLMGFTPGVPPERVVEYPPADAEGMRKELASIELELNRTCLPTVQVVLEDEVVESPIQVDSDGRPLEVFRGSDWRLFGTATGTLEGRSEGGVVVRSKLFRRVDGGYGSEEGELLRTEHEFGTEWRTGTMNALVPFAALIGGLVKLCEASAKSGNSMRIS